MATHNRHILVVEDDADGQEMMATLLGHLNITVDVAEDALQAEQYLFGSNNAYRAAVIDLALPDKDGWQILSEVLENPRTAELPCIAVTAFHTSKLREDAIRAGFRAYFSKPLDATAFLRELEKLI